MTMTLYTPGENKIIMYPGRLCGFILADIIFSITIIILSRRRTGLVLDISLVRLYNMILLLGYTHETE